MKLKVLALGGDGIGPEVVASGLRVLEAVAGTLGLKVEVTEDLLHGAAWDEYGTFIRSETIRTARDSDALLVGWPERSTRADANARRGRNTVPVTRHQGNCTKRRCPHLPGSISTCHKDDCQPGHLPQVVGDEPCVMVEFDSQTAATYAQD
ncbi:MAG TPA: hypothetical protein DG761_04730 [Gammaproteobacteria bacterium]|nr:hypothetical protein [Acidiferrobacteraceae bacterium]MDP6399429.1 isocitrate/isopropylmalate family dehydrogenase [Arenicellales bacterium]MDP6551766.1 isocitrate/isopropylmalate family dehydrogenase [Arenicellales bacterium]MDP6918080.1 isocitrate/isopropylmalate family dehydrogenase [Arenicellales bacterium]HCX87305.1 hypothetical protein [Gammaproteobacteria bacterium]|tara:strand:- start:5 stop:457 length:453 start_codon:yes stop_codon:yes gene_type:complete